MTYPCKILCQNFDAGSEAGGNKCEFSFVGYDEVDKLSDIWHFQNA